ncbi:hypothetical protein KSC_090860 [Ktedonobacter sp. SOSP1-52]|nr:hypothetical protein KSC_090860 [Ktedonobacter sp. SOSP1-52]
MRALTSATFPETLRLVMASGEPPSNKIVSTFTNDFKGAFSYLYGGPEAAYSLEMDVAEQADENGQMLSGHATSMAVYILNARKQLVPPGGSGEIYVAGPGIASGYLDHPEENQQHFLKDIYSDARMFKTGLRGRYRSTGKIEIQDTDGRQIWVGGYAVWLDAIEDALLREPTIYSCRIIARRNLSGARELVAYIVTANQSPPEFWLEQLGAALPESWRPQAYIPVSHIPLTGTGTVDDQALLTMAPLNTQVMAQWEQYLRRQEGVKQVALVVQEHIDEPLPLHLADLLPDLGRHAQPQEKPSSAPVQREQVSTNQRERLSISEGGILHLDQVVTTLPQALLQAASQRDSHARVIYVLSDGSEIVWTYQQLLQEAQRVLGGLRQLGVHPQDKVIMQVERCQEFLPLLWGCLLGGMVPVPVSIAPTYEKPTSASSRLHHAWQLLGQPIVVAGSNLAPSLQVLAQNEDWNNFQVVPFSSLQTSTACDETYHESQPEDLALILLTSGSTGASKGVTLNHRNLLSMVQGMIQRFEFSPREDVTFNWMPLDHVGGIVMLHLRSLYMGSTQIHALPQTILQDPLRWLDYLDRYRATVTWTANFALGLINERAEEIQQRHWDLSALRYLLNGGEAIVGKIARTFLQVLQLHKLPATAMYPAWGMSETSSGVVFSNQFASRHDNEADQLVEVGEPIPGLSVRLVNENNQVVPEGQVGRMQVRGLSITGGYYHNVQATREAFTADGWFDTGDLGLMREGQLTITGRAKDTIIINGINYYSQEIEAAVEELEEVETSYTAACAVREGESATDQLAIFVVSRADDTQILDLLRKVRARVSAQVGIAPTYVLPVARDAIPKTSIGKIQRTQLKKEFEAGAYRDLLKELDRLQGNANTLPDWFYRQRWQPLAIRQPEMGHAGDIILLLMDKEGLGAALCEYLQQKQQRVIRVESGPDFARLGDDHYTIEPDTATGYRLLGAALEAEQLTINHVIHLWGYHPSPEGHIQENHLKEAYSQGVLSVLHLVQALEPYWKSEEHKQSKLVVVSNQLAAVNAVEAVAFEKAPILGLLKTLDRELPWLQCMHIDLPLGQAAQNALRVSYDLYQHQKEPEVAYRDGQRLVARLEHIDWSQEPTQPSPLQKQGFYLLSGGLGGVGYELACHLLQEYQAHLLLIGRTPVSADQDERTTRLAALRELAQQGGAVYYAAVDVCDLAGLQQAVSLAQQQWERPLDGILHLASTFHEQALLGESRQQFEQILHAKVDGTWTLHQLLKERPNALFVHFSSVNAFFGGSGVGAYASANSFLESFAHYQRTQCSLQSYCLAWSMWDEVGMSRGYQLKGFSRANGYQPIAPRQGWYSLLTALQHTPTSLLVGLDGSNQHIRRYLTDSSYALHELVAYLAPRLQRRTQQGWPVEWGALPVNYRLVQMAALPLKEEGEIDVERLGKVNHARRQSEAQEPRSKLEQQLVEIWRQVLNTSQVGVLDNFFEMGGHSLLATQVIARLQRILQVNIPVRSLFEYPTIASLAQLIEAQHQQLTTAPELMPVAREQLLPLSFGQQRLWFLDQLEPGNTSYNIPVSVEFEGKLNLEAFEASLTTIIERHEGLRTTFQEIEGQPYQTISPRGHSRLVLIDLQGLPLDQREAVARALSEQENQQPFDLKHGPLLRYCLWRLNRQKHWLRLNMHHIVSDGWSMGILVQELTALYQAFRAGEPSPLPSLPIQYADYASWQRGWLQGEVLKEQIRYWTQQLNGARALELPTDCPRTRALSQRGAHYGLQLDAQLAPRLRQLSQQEGATLFMTLLAAFQVLLYRLSGQEDIVVGTDSANRSHLETEKLIGFFVNLLALRTSMQDHPGFTTLLQRVREMVLAAYAHQELPFEMIVEHLRLPREGNRTPLVNALFVMQNVPLTEAELPGVVARPVDREISSAKFDLAFFVSEGNDSLHCAVNYSTDLFKEATIAKMLRNYEVLLKDILDHPDTPVDSLEIQSATEKDEGEKSRQQGIIARKGKLKKIDRTGIELN